MATSPGENEDDLQPEYDFRTMRGVVRGKFTIAEEQAPPDLTECQKKDLTRRLAELDADPNNVLTWEEIKAYINRAQ
jgi:putative addiction module component (TIGR02574 family)